MTPLLLLLLLFVPLLDALAQLLEALAVLQLDLSTAPEVVLQLLHDRHLRLYPQVQAAQLLVQLLAHVYDGWGGGRKCSLVDGQERRKVVNGRGDAQRDRVVVTIIIIKDNTH